VSEPIRPAHEDRKFIAGGRRLPRRSAAVATQVTPLAQGPASLAQRHAPNPAPDFTHHSREEQLKSMAVRIAFDSDLRTNSFNSAKTGRSAWLRGSTSTIAARTAAISAAAGQSAR
jgi:hypothetical protein